MKYIDLHCDSVTACCDKGEDFNKFSGQVSPEKLKNSGCAAQCFAIFTDGKNASEDFERYSEFYNASLKNCGLLAPVRKAEDVAAANAEGLVGAILTVENIGFLKRAKDIGKLQKQGVKMLSLVWNYKNAFASPNLVFKNDYPDFSARCNEGLSEEGKKAVEYLNGTDIILDVSHLSDGGVEDALKLCSKPVIASHSNCYALCPVSRNLTDGQIKKIADKGGVVGLNFCRDFLGEGEVFALLYEQFKHLIKVGGEDVACIGSDFDGIPRYAEMDDCTYTAKLLNYFAERGVSEKILDKFAYGNFMRVLRDAEG